MPLLGRTGVGWLMRHAVVICLLTWYLCVYGVMSMVFFLGGVLLWICIAEVCDTGLVYCVAQCGTASRRCSASLCNAPISSGHDRW